MATQTAAQVRSEISTLIAIAEELRKFAETNSSGALSNYVAREETRLDVAAGDFTAVANAALQANLRAKLAEAISGGNLASIMNPSLRNYAEVIGTITETDPIGILRRIYDQFVTDSDTVNSRNITHASPSAGSNIGDGVINRLTVDENNYEIENIHVEAKRADCLKDEHTGAEEHEEIFEFRGATKAKDDLALSGSGLRKLIRAKSARDSLIRNASFSQYTGTLADPTAITDWTVGSAIGNFNVSETAAEIYRGFKGDSTPRSVEFTTNDSLSQDFDVNGIKLNPLKPYYCQVAYNRSINSGDGLLTLTMGNHTASVDLGSASAGWQVLRVAIGQNSWPKNFSDADDPEIKIEITGRTTGSTFIDDVIFVEMDEFDSTYYTVVGGATPFVGNHHDTFTWTDSLAGSDSIIQKWLWRIYNFMLPHDNAGGETWADPSV